MTSVRTLPLFVVSLALISTSVSVSAAKPKFCRTVLGDRGAVQYLSAKSSSHRVNFANDLALGKELKALSAAAGQKSFMDPEFRTRIFVSGGGDANNRGELPIVDPKAKALFVFFHGSGTMNSSGKGFSAQFSELSRLGYAGLSFDMPFHADGPKENKLNDSDEFMNWVHGIVSKYRRPGQPVVLVGHSFGPEVVFEYRYRYGDTEEGVSGLGLSPAGFNPTLEKWYKQYTSKMKFGGDVATNTVGSEWAGQVTRGFRWNKAEAKSFPNFPVTVLTGNWEEYVPGPVGGKNGTPIGKNTYDMKAALLKLLPDANVVVEDGVGHYIFAHRDASGTNVILREMLRAVGKTPADIPELAKEAGSISPTAIQLLLNRYATDTVFASWADLYFQNGFVRLVSSLLMRPDDGEVYAKRVMVTYQTQLNARLGLIFEEIKKTKDTDPDFYNQHAKSIETGRDVQTLVTGYMERLSQMAIFDPTVGATDRSPEEMQAILSMQVKSEK